MAAARDLTLRGVRVAIIEARDRIGGRIFTIRPQGAPQPVELGAEFVHGRPPETFAIAQQAGLVLAEMGGTRWEWRAGRFQPRDRSQMESILAALHAWQGEDQTYTTFAEAHFPGEEWAEARRQVARYLAGFDAADPDQVGITWKAQTEAALEAIDGGRQCRVVGGYDQVMHALAMQLPAERASLHLNTIACEVAWEPGRVSVTARVQPGDFPRAFTARAAVITVPLGVLLAPPQALGALRFVPEIPHLAPALAGLAMGHVVKIVFRFREIFWDAVPPGAIQLPRLSFLFTDDAAMTSWWTTDPLLTPMLVGWLGGPQAEQVARQSDNAIIRQALGALAQVTGMAERDLAAGLMAWHLHNWSADPFARGAYSFGRAGGMLAAAQLSTPFAQTLFFAGEATNTEGHAATVHGALATGYRAAAQVVAHLQ